MRQRQAGHMFMQPELNIYICSTVRHLLFSLLRAASSNEDDHQILYFSDYQNASLKDWNFGRLPKNIVTHDVTRRTFRQQLDATTRGRLCYFLAMRNLGAPTKILEPLHEILKTSAPELAEQLAAGKKVRLWLFNERNKMSRIFRLLVRHFSLIEDGESNYLLLGCPWWKWPARLVLGLPARTRVFGDDPRCDSIWVLYPNRLPQYVRDKGRLIDFLDGSVARDLMARIFGDFAPISGDADQIIVATQPFGIPGVNDADKQRVFDQIVSYLEAQGRRVVLKVHPAEDPGDYDFLGTRVVRVAANIPLEVMLLGRTTPAVILSVLSTAGMGFERYCQRIKLCEDSPYDAEYFRTVQSWVEEPRKLDKALQEKLPG